MEQNNKKETFEFQAEVKQLLDIMAHSLYTHKEVFIRELISNASDALNKVYFLQLTEPENVYGEGAVLCVRIEFSKTDKALIIKDTGVGMAKQEIIDNIGTIARSGTRSFMEKISKEKDNEKLSDIIGQFGVGFYSCFVVAKKVEVTTKSYIKDEPSYRWTSDGSGKYTLEPAEKKDRGTEIKIFLKPDEEEFIEKERVQNIIKKYSNFLRYPIYIEQEQVNTIEAIWTKQPANLKDEDYKEFYKFVTHRDTGPLFRIHKSSDAPIQFYILLFCVDKNLNFFGQPDSEYGPDLYSNKVLIQQQCKDLIPGYLRFIKGVVDSPDISLNISRETIQNNKVVIKIREFIVKSVIKELENLLKNDRETYIKFYNEFHRELKEGINTDFSHREKIAELLLFNSSACKDKDELVTLKDYIARKHPEQKEIYYMSGTDRESIEKSPYLEIFKKKKLEVLYLTEPIDEVVLANLMKFEELDLKSIDTANLDKIKDIGEEKTGKEEKIKIKKLCGYFKDLLKDKIISVVESERLTESPYCLVNPNDAMSSHIQKIMKMMDKNFTGSKKILELNPSHQLIKGLDELYKKDKGSVLLKNLCLQVFDNALMLDGEAPDLINMTDRIKDIMQAAIETAET